MGVESSSRGLAESTRGDLDGELVDEEDLRDLVRGEGGGLQWAVAALKDGALCDDDGGGDRGRGSKSSCTFVRRDGLGLGMGVQAPPLRNVR